MCLQSVSWFEYLSRSLRHSSHQYPLVHQESGINPRIATPPRIIPPYTFTNSCLHCSVAVTRLKQAIIWVMCGVWCGWGVMTVWVGEGVVGYCFLGSESQGTNKKCGKLLRAELESPLLISRTDKISDPESAERIPEVQYVVTRSRTDKL